MSWKREQAKFFRRQKGQQVLLEIAHAAIIFSVVYAVFAWGVWMQN